LLVQLRQVVLALAQQEQVVLVGHSFGALLVMAFAHLYPEQVRGIVLVDPVSVATWSAPDPENAARLRRAVRLSRRGAFLTRMGVTRAALSLLARGSRWLPSIVARLSAGRGSSVLNRLANEVSKLPAAAHGPICAHWSRPTSFLTMADYLRLLPSAARQAANMPVPRTVPMIILSAETASSAEIQEREQWILDRPNSRHQQVPNTSHWLQLDRADLVIAAVREILDRM
jgi:pimeloyl-ACP methyl ester carboxylesterase